MYATTRDFVAALEKSGDLARVAARVSPILEITELADRQSKSAAPNLPAESTRRTDPRFHHLGGKALLFENVEGSDMPVLINQFGSYHRMEMALGAPALRAGRLEQAPGSESRATQGLESLAQRLAKLVKPEPPPTLLAKLKKLPELLELAKIPPKRVKRGICQEVTLTGEQIDLKRLPLIRCWPLDGDLAAVGHPANTNDHIPGVESGPEWNKNFRGRYITLGGIHTIHADDRDHPNPPSRNIGMYRVQLLGKKHMAMHWHMHHDGARHWRSWKARGERMPVAIALGGESVLPYAATAPMPPGISELLLAGFLNRAPIHMVRGKTVPIDVPANSEIVIEGWVDVLGTPPVPGGRIEPAGDRRATQVLEGPFGDHTGFYSLPDRYPLLEVTAITHRRDPIYPTTVVGLPPQEDYFMGKATERLFLPLLRTIIPDIIDYDLPMFGAFHNCVFAKIRKEYPLQARRVMSSIWGAGQMAWTKTIVVVDEDVDVHDTHAVLKAVGEQCHPTRDVEMIRGPIDILDHATPFLGAGAKIGLDATRKTSEAETFFRFESPLPEGGGWGKGEWSKVVNQDRIVVQDFQNLNAMQPEGPNVHSRGLSESSSDTPGSPVPIPSAPRRGATVACYTEPLTPVLAEAARATERRILQLPNVLDAQVPEELGGWWLIMQINKQKAGDGLRAIKAIGALSESPFPEGRGWGKGSSLAVPHLSPSADPPTEKAITLPCWTIVVGPDADLANPPNLDSPLFHWLAHMSPERDRSLSICGRRTCFDSTPKMPGDEVRGYPVRDWPPILRMSDEVIATVTRRQAEYGV